MAASRTTQKPTLATLMAGDRPMPEETKAAFHRKARSVLKKLAEALALEKQDFDIRSNKAGPAVSGEVILHAERFYIQIAVSDGPGEVLFRRCAGRKDFSGGDNHWAGAADIEDIAAFAERLKRELALDGGEDPAATAEPVQNKVIEIPLDRLQVSPLNVRIAEVDDEADRQLAANIRRRGQLQNLIVYKAEGGVFEVAGGGRRLEAMRSLALPDDHPVNCLVAAKDVAIELSTAENLRRSTMHAADEAEAFRLMIESGREIADVAAEFGFSERLVKQRLKLAALAPDLTGQFRRGEMTLDVGMALTLTDDHGRQTDLWNQVRHYDSGYQRNSIRRALTTEKVSGHHRLAKFVGAAAYEQAGGTVVTDLFSKASDPGSLWFDDLVLLGKLAEQKLEAKAAELRDHWLWAKPTIDFDHNNSWTVYCREPGEKPELPADMAAEHDSLVERAKTLANLDDSTDADEAELERMEDRIGEIEAWPEENPSFSKEIREQGGCVVTINADGFLTVHQGLIRKSDLQGDKSDQQDDKSAGAAPADTAGDDTGRGSSGTSTSVVVDATPPQPASSDDKETGSLRISEVLGDDLGAHRTQCLQAALAQDYELSGDILLYILIRDVLRDASYWNKPSELSARRVHLKSSLNDLGSTPAADELAAIEERLPRGYQLFSGEEQLRMIRDLPTEDKAALQAACMAMTLTARSVKPERTDTFLLDFICGDLGGDVVIASRWRPTAANFWGRIPMKQALAIGGKVLGADWQRRHANDKKMTLCQALEKAFATGDEAFDGITAEARGRAAAWLPPGMGAASPDMSMPDDQETEDGRVDDELPDFLAGDDDDDEAEPVEAAAA